MIILYFDDRYFKWAQLLIESLKTHEPAEKITVFGYNLLSSQKEKILSFYNVKALAEIKMEAPFKKVTDKQRKYRENGARGLLIGKKAWYVRKTFKKFPGEDLYLLMDADMLLLRPLTVFKRQMKSHDMAGAFGISKKQLLKGIEKIKIAGGFLAFKPTKAIKRMLKEWDKILADDWSENQPSLAKLYRKYAKSIKFLDVDRWKYMDARSRDDSILWSAHKAKSGAKEKRHRTYLAKLQKMKEEKSK